MSETNDVSHVFQSNKRKGIRKGINICDHVCSPTINRNIMQAVKKCTTHTVKVRRQELEKTCRIRSADSAPNLGAKILYGSQHRLQHPQGKCFTLCSLPSHLRYHSHWDIFIGSLRLQRRRNTMDALCCWWIG